MPVPLARCLARNYDGSDTTWGTLGSRAPLSPTAPVCTGLTASATIDECNLCNHALPTKPPGHVVDGNWVEALAHPLVREARSNAGNI